MLEKVAVIAAGLLWRDGQGAQECQHRTNTRRGFGGWSRLSRGARRGRGFERCFHRRIRGRLRICWRVLGGSTRAWRRLYWDSWSWRGPAWESQ